MTTPVVTMQQVAAVALNRKHFTMETSPRTTAPFDIIEITATSATGETVRIDLYVQPDFELPPFTDEVFP